MSMRRISLLGFALGGLAALGCVTPLSEAEIGQQLERATEGMRLGRSRVMPITAETGLLAKALLYEARADRRSELSRQLSRRIAVAAKRRQHVVVGGPYPDLSDQVLSNALLLNDAEQLAGIKVVLVSAETPSPRLARAASGAGVRLYHRSLP